MELDFIGIAGELEPIISFIRWCTCWADKRPFSLTFTSTDNLESSVNPVVRTSHENTHTSTGGTLRLHIGRPELSLKHGTF